MLILQRLQSLKTASSGDVYGVQDGVTGDVTMLAVTVARLPHAPSLLLPPALHLLASFTCLPEGGQQSTAQKQHSSERNLHLTVKNKVVNVEQHDEGSDKWRVLKYSIVSQEQFEQQMVACRTTGRLDLSCNVAQAADIESTVSRWSSLLHSAASFRLRDTKLVLGIKGVLSSEHELDNVGDLIHNHNKNGYKKLNNLTFDLFVNRSCSSSTDAPHLIINNTNTKVQNTFLELDCVAYVFRSTPVVEVGRVLQQSILQKLQLAKYWLGKLHNENIKGNLESINVLPYKAGHLYTLMYPNNSSDDKLEDYRKSVHECFLLPMKTPLMRRVNGYVFELSKEEYQLCNTHIGLKAPAVSGMTSITQGIYSYHHYMQDKFNDNKWGCAYRSLQTIVSWFRHQGYTTKTVPTHTQIQQCLVNIGDKQSKFVGSRDWIGSTEVGFVLENYLGVTSRFLTVSSGSELGEKGRELVHHFSTQGTPIMIGGGVLAHTILGVAWDPESGDISYLILDPHYTGAEDLTTIQRMGWCGWKSPSFWNDKAYYNLCMPQRPAMI
uniref:Probable Ufm1-specific protease 2 n=1 Tax=Hirondellea gigas TaxID=1518452 RepID=A0A6A7FZS6_9CRUS